jgi:hypothetical protein
MRLGPGSLRGNELGFTFLKLKTCWVDREHVEYSVSL